ncbi:hypothetical protein XI08_30335 [Bradyrhizobium sp. CCBAU 11361]|nr:hypothetical protein [Bradyrhizobium sp. CCBAU 11361]
MGAGGASLDALADKFGLDRDAIWRHWSKHVPGETKVTYLCGPAQSAELVEKAASEGDSVLDLMLWAIEPSSPVTRAIVSSTDVSRPAT